MLTRTWKYGTTYPCRVLRLDRTPEHDVLFVHANNEGFMLVAAPWSHGNARPGDLGTITFVEGGPNGGHWTYRPAAPSFIADLVASLDDAAKLEFREIEQRILLLQMQKVGMAGYPPLQGPAEGERCSGEMVCEFCRRTYFEHPMDWRVIGYGNVPFLNVLCDGRRVKL